jgi:hypothetical protein
MNRVFLWVGFLIIANNMVGCAGPRVLEPGAENVKIIKVTTILPKSCKFLGEISNDNVHGNMDILAPQKALKSDDIIFLKNEGNKLGANLVVFKQHRTTYVPEYRRGMGPEPINVSIDNIIGSAYLCPFES